jgi:hypothetical protein
MNLKGRKHRGWKVAYRGREQERRKEAEEDQNAIRNL